MQTMRRERFASGTVAALAGIAIVRGPARPAQFEYRCGIDFPASHPVTVGVTEFAAAVRRESGGRLNIKVFPDSILGSDPSMITQTRGGALEMSFQGSGPLSGVVPVAMTCFVGFAFRQRAQAIGALNGALAQLIRKELEAKGLVMFPRMYEAGFRQITTGTRAIRNADDLNGLKIKIPFSTISVDMWKTLGASPVSLGAAETYTALQTHLVDAQDAVFSTIVSQKTYEVQKYLSITNHQWANYWLVMNPQAWQALPPDIQEIVRRNNDRSGTRETRIAEAQNAASADLLVRYGMKMNAADVGTFQAKLRQSGYYQRWKNELGATAWSALEEYCGRLV